MNQAFQVFGDINENEVSSKEAGYSLIEQHQKTKKEILESSLLTLEEGKELLSKIKEMSVYGTSVTDKNRTSTVCCSIEHLLETLNDKRLHLEELWKNRKAKLEYCIQIFFLRQGIKKTLDWILNEGNTFLEDTRLGTNYSEALEFQVVHNAFIKTNYKNIHDNVMQWMRSADQFVHTGLERADEAHQEAHILHEKWEKFALKLEHRRKLLSIVVSFYKQTDQASERLKQIQRDIELEEEKIKKLSSVEESRTASAMSKSSVSKSKSSSIRKDSISSSNEELTQRHADLSNQLAEVSGPGLREAKIILEKVGREEDFQSKHVIKRVHEFTEHIRDLKTKLSNDIQDKIVKSVESENNDESKLFAEIIEFENKYNNVFSWITNVGETFLTYHRDMGVDVRYVSDYVDNHQQMESDLKENLIELNKLREKANNLLKNCQTDEPQVSQIRKNMERIEKKWANLKKSVEQRIIIAADHLEFIKLLNKFRNSALDLQELFKTASDYMSNINSNNIFEQRLQDKMNHFEMNYKELVGKGKLVIEMLKKTDSEVLKLNSNHIISDIEIMLSSSASLFESMQNNLKLWREKMLSRNMFKEQWTEFITTTKETIKKTVEIEESFFSESNNSSSSLQHHSEVRKSYQKKVDDLIQVLKVKIFSFILNLKIFIVCKQQTKKILSLRKSPPT